MRLRGAPVAVVLSTEDAAEAAAPASRGQKPDPPAEALLKLANRVRRLLPHWQDPEHFFAARDELAAEIRRVARELG